MLSFLTQEYLGGAVCRDRFEVISLEDPMTNCYATNSVTNVGATKVYPGKTVYDPESAAYDPAGYPYSANYSSGGGFSNVYPIPKYQQSAVATYFEKHNPPYKHYSALAPDTGDITKLPDIGALAGKTGGIYNRIGRGVPDVAANGDNIAVRTSSIGNLRCGTDSSATGLHWW